MPYKYDSAGNIVVVEHEGKKLPVFVDSTGKEVPFDADVSVGKISSLNGESRDHRLRADKAEQALTAFKDLDPVKAREALDAISKIDQKKLVDAGEIDKVRNEIKSGFDKQIADLTSANSALENQLVDMRLGAAFTGSKFVSERVAIPVEFLRSRFEQHFGFKDGKMFAVDAAGNQIYSKDPQRIGELAGFDEALEILVTAHPNKDQILKGAGASGSGARNNGNGNGGGGGGGKRTITRTAFNALDPAAQMKAATEMAVVDG